MPVLTERKPDSPYVLNSRGISHSRVFDIEAESEPDALIVLFNETGIERGVVFRNSKGDVPDPNLLCQEIEVFARVPAPLNGTGLYQVTCDYDIPDAEQPEIDGPVVWDVELSSTREEVEVDRHGDPLRNAAGQPYDPPLTMPVVSEVIVARWIRSGVDYFDAIALSRRFRSRVNSQPWKGADPREVYCHSLKPRQIQPSVVSYTARFEWKNGRKVGNVSNIPGWDPAGYEKGRVVVSGTDGDGNQRYAAITDDQGAYVVEDYLTAEGTRLPVGGTKVLKVWELLDQVDFNDLGI